MDPLSITAAISGISMAAAHILSSVRGIQNTIRDAPKFLQDVTREVKGIRACLDQLQCFLNDRERVDGSRSKLLIVDDVKVTFSDCVYALSDVQRLLDQVTANKDEKQLGTSMSVATRVRLAWREKEIKESLRRLESSKSTLHLMVSILTG